MSTPLTSPAVRASYLRRVLTYLLLLIHGTALTAAILTSSALLSMVWLGASVLSAPHAFVLLFAACAPSLVYWIAKRWFAYPLLLLIFILITISSHTIGHPENVIVFFFFLALLGLLPGALSLDFLKVGRATGFGLHGLAAVAAGLLLVTGVVS